MTRTHKVSSNRCVIIVNSFLPVSVRYKPSSRFETAETYRIGENVQVLPIFDRIKKKLFLFWFTNNTNVKKNCGFS